MFVLTPQKRKDFGSLLRECRNKRGMSLQEVASYINIPFGMIALIERGGETKIKIEVIEKFCLLYGLDEEKICISIGKIPSKIFFKIILHPELLQVIKNYKV